MLSKEIAYIKIGDYLLPNLTLENKSEENIGKYGLLRLNYLKQYKRILYYQLLSKNELSKHLVDIDKLATERTNMIIKKMAIKNKVDEKMKLSNQLRWVEMMNNLKSQAEEIVLAELIYILQIYI